MINYEFIIKNIYAIDKPNQSNYILQINYIYKGTNENNSEYEIERWLNYSEDSSTDFVPFESITKADIIKWIEDDLGSDGLEFLKFQVSEGIEALEETAKLLPTKKVNIPE